MAIEVEIPIYADEPPHFLLWAVDEIMPILLGLGVGILMGHIFIATVIGFVVILAIIVGVLDTASSFVVKQLIML